MENDGRLNRVESRLDRVDARLDNLDLRVDRLEAGQARLEVGQARLEANHAELSHQMRVLHEDLVDSIKAASKPDAPSRAEWREWLAELREENSRRIVPLEAAVKYLLERH